MAVLSDPERAALVARLAREVSALRATLGLTKAEFRAAVDAADGWVDSNASSFNTALPVAARNALTAQQKALLLARVVLRRYEVA